MYIWLENCLGFQPGHYTVFSAKVVWKRLFHLARKLVTALWHFSKRGPSTFIYLPMCRIYMDIKYLLIRRLEPLWMKKKNHFTGHLPLYPTCKVSQGALFWNLISKQILAHLAIIMEPVYWDHENLNPLCAKFVRGNIIMYIVFTFYVIPPHWHETGSWNSTSWKTRICLLYIPSSL